MCREISVIGVGRVLSILRGGRRLLLACQAHIASREYSRPQDTTYQDSYPGNPQDVPEASDHTRESSELRDHLRDGDNA